MLNKSPTGIYNGCYEVICTTGRIPTVVHADEESAIAEANRLAKQNPEKVFEVVKIVARVRAVVIVDVNKDDVPF